MEYDVTFESGCEALGGACHGRLIRLTTESAALILRDTTSGADTLLGDVRRLCRDCVPALSAEEQAALDCAEPSGRGVAPEEVEVLCRLLDMYDPKLSLVFCNTKKQVDELVSALQLRGYFAEALHGDLKQQQRDRVMASFRNGKTGRDAGSLQIQLHNPCRCFRLGLRFFYRCRRCFI